MEEGDDELEAWRRSEADWIQHQDHHRWEQYARSKTFESETRGDIDSLHTTGNCFEVLYHHYHLGSDILGRPGRVWPMGLWVSFV